MIRAENEHHRQRQRELERQQRSGLRPAPPVPQSHDELMATARAQGFLQLEPPES